MIVPVDRAWHWAWGAATTASLRRNRQEQLLCNFNVSSKISSRKSWVHKICDIRMVNYKFRVEAAGCLENKTNNYKVTGSDWMGELWDADMNYFYCFILNGLKWVWICAVFLWGCNQIPENILPICLGVLSVFLELNEVKEIWAGEFIRTLENRTKHHFQKAP